jgi:N-methylhydantoinase A
VNARVTVVGELPELPQEPALTPRPPGRPRTTRQIHLGRRQQVPIFDLEALTPGQTITGPAIVEAPTTTVLLRHNDSATVTPLGWLDIAVAPA